MEKEKLSTEQLEDIENLWNGTSFGSKYLIRIISLRSLIETNLMITIYSTRDKWLAQLFKMPRRVYVLVLVFFLEYSLGSVPIVINTWTLPQAAQRAWEFIQNGSNSIDALEAGCGLCENLACGTSIGYGGNPDEAGETTLDAMIFDGKTMDMGGVGALRRVKGAISVAKHVLLYTLHSLIVGDQATAFAVNLGFPEETLTTDNSTAIWQNWTNYNCQPNHWMNVEPNPATSCGPYQPLSENSVLYDHSLTQETIEERTNHDTIGMIVIDGDGNIAAGTSTNGLRYKIPGRVGDSPLPGAGAYADNDVGGACATGNGDVMMRFLPSFLAVEEMRRGSTPADAAGTAIRRIIRKYPAFSGAVIAVNKFGEYGAACNIMDSFPYAYINNETNEVIVQTVPCMVSQGIELNPPKFLIILVLFNLLKFCT